MKIVPRIFYRRWKHEEDTILTAGLEAVGSSWTILSRMLPGRSPVDCRKRYVKHALVGPDPMPAILKSQDNIKELSDKACAPSKSSPNANPLPKSLESSIGSYFGTPEKHPPIPIQHSPLFKADPQDIKQFSYAETQHLEMSLRGYDQINDEYIFIPMDLTLDNATKFISGGTTTKTQIPELLAGRPSSFHFPRSIRDFFEPCTKLEEDLPSKARLTRKEIESQGWSIDELMTLREAYEQFPLQWKKISSYLPRRSAEECRLKFMHENALYHELNKDL